MFPPHTRSAAVSLVLHAALLGFAARGAGTQPSRSSAAGATPFEAAIAIEPAAAPEGGASSSPASSSPARTSAAEVADAPLERARVARPAAARTRPSPPPAPPPAPPSPAAVPAPTQASATVGSAAPARAASTPPDAAGHAGEPAAPSAEGAGASGAGLASARAATRGGAAASTGDGAAPQLASYLKRVRERVSRHREYPYLARRANLEGTVCLRVSIAASGRVLDVTPTCGTSHVPLLRAALSSVSSAAPFPPLPAALGQRLTVEVPVVFALDEL